MVTSMERLQLFEFGDLSFLPTVLRRVYHDCLGTVSRMCGFYSRMHVPFSTWVQNDRDTPILDLASGAAGPVETMLEKAKQQDITLPQITLSDLFPNEKQFKKLRDRYGEEQISYVAESISALDPPLKQYSLVSICAAFHHFSPDDAKRIIEQAVLNGKGIFIVEPFQRKLTAVLSSISLGPFLGMMAPFFSYPWRIRNFLFCTLIPVVPLMLAFDGVVSVLRTYTIEELENMLPKELKGELRIRSGKLPNRIWQPSIFFYAIRR